MIFKDLLLLLYTWPVIVYQCCNILWLYHTSKSMCKLCCILVILFFSSILYWLCYYSCLNFSPFALLCLVSPFPLVILPLSSCPWVMHTSSLASPLPLLFLTSPCLFCTYPVMLLNVYIFSPTLLLLADSPQNDVHVYDSISTLVVCLVCFLDSVFDSCEIVVILMFIVLIFFFLNKTL